MEQPNQKGGLTVDNRLPSGKSGQEVGEKISIKGTFYGKYRVLAIFIICTAVLTAAFAATAIWHSTENGRLFFERLQDKFSSHEANEDPQNFDPTVPNPDADPSESEKPETDLENRVPNGAIPVVSKDLSYLSRGEGYFLNETPYAPKPSELMERRLSLGVDETAPDAPLVLIVHTHTVESYLPKDIFYVEGGLSAATYSSDPKKNMLAVGKALGEYLNQNGIPTLLCTVVHTGEGMSLQGSYARAEESIRAYLKQYPSIQLVIDLHRDAVMTEEGAYVRTALPNGEDATAQVMAVVGTDCNGTEHERWENNLALALQLRRELNLKTEGICRPVYLRTSSYNQELAPYSLLLEIGTGGNTLEQAKRTAEYVGSALVNLFYRA